MHWRLAGTKAVPYLAGNLGAVRKDAPCPVIPARSAAAQTLLRQVRRPIGRRRASRRSILRALQAGNDLPQNRHPKTPIGSRHPVWRRRRVWLHRPGNAQHAKQEATEPAALGIGPAQGAFLQQMYEEKILCEILRVLAGMAASADKGVHRITIKAIE